MKLLSNQDHMMEFSKYIIHNFLSCCCIHITLSDIRAEWLVLRDLDVFKLKGPVSCMLENLQN